MVVCLLCTWLRVWSFGSGLGDGGDVWRMDGEVGMLE